MHFSQESILYHVLTCAPCTRACFSGNVFQQTFQAIDNEEQRITFCKRFDHDLVCIAMEAFKRRDKVENCSVFLE